MTYPTIRVDTWFQGPTGSGQGGWTSAALQRVIGQSVSVAIRAPIPLDVDLEVRPVGAAWELAPSGSEHPVLIATPWSPDVPETAPVTIEDAAEASTRFPLFDDHPVPVCFSCGLEHDSMRVHAGELVDGRWSSPWTAPAWATQADGTTDPGALWAAIDCCQAWFAGNAGGRRHSVTVQIAVDVLEPIQPGETYSLVAWSGDYLDGWDGRKRGACGAVFTAEGRCVARSRTFWVALPHERIVAD